MKRRGRKVRSEVAYGKVALSFDLPSCRFLGNIRKKAAGCKNIAHLLSNAFREPSASRALKSALKGARRILVAVTDDTRNSHLERILPYLLAKIDDGKRNIKVIVATGLHKPHTKEQMSRLVGARVIREYEVVSHHPDEGSVRAAGRTDRGVPVTLDKNVFESDAVISVGTIEPHLYAGYSGGAKTVGIGLAGEATVNDTHGVRFLDDPRVAIGSIDHNPFQDVLWASADKARLRFCVNVVNAHNGLPSAVFCGEPRETFRRGVEFARKIYEISVKRQADIVVCGIGYPKDVNLYQASRAINYVTNVGRPVLRKGGALIVAAEMTDGPGKSAAELKFYETLKAMRSPQSFIDKVKRCGCVAGEHRAYMVAGPAADYEIIFVNRTSPRFMKGLPFKSFSTVGAAFEHAATIVGANPSAYVIPHSLVTIARAA